MGWLDRIFGKEKAAAAPAAPATTPSAPTSAPTQTAASAPETIPPERVGLNGEYDQSGLAKRVAQAFDRDPNVGDIETLWVAQTGSTVVLKGTAPNEQELQTMVAIARTINGATDVDTSQVTIGG
ncbi:MULTISPECIES: BON domain-containing protein [Trichocoleus]|uniref:BON domain-containing protein n=1 Tax=Trichocoleus desertorum GB2-A4 TaxID=2933944 RepID=A0ABV0JCL2_9CYAN|nr:BON domain-containing protein [Trichocoleus sp. FACHB-46]MBD1863252.1 BON domain-containing protein [Trichocoleus sp. FACHB-46]